MPKQQHRRDNKNQKDYIESQIKTRSEVENEITKTK